MRLSRYTPESGGRPMCYSCLRPSSHCVCNLISPFKAHFNILILQHPHERKKYYGTAKLVTKAIENSKLIRGIEFRDPGVIENAFVNTKSYLLYPSKYAVDCEAVKLDSDSTVIVLDGTWDEAGKILYRNKNLKNLPCLTFKRELKSNYKIRKQPKDHYLSTIESIAHLLKLNAKGMRLFKQSKLYDSLFDGFSRMVDNQAKHVPRLNRIAS